MNVVFKNMTSLVATNEDNMPSFFVKPILNSMYIWNKTETACMNEIFNMQILSCCYFH